MRRTIFEADEEWTSARLRKEQLNDPEILRIAIYVTGSFPKSLSGNKYIFVAMDYFSKWPEAYAIPNQETATVARVLVDELISRFGVPLELHSDQGRNFESAVFNKVMTLLGIRKTRTTLSTQTEWLDD